MLMSDGGVSHEHATVDISNCSSDDSIQAAELVDSDISDLGLSLLQVKARLATAKTQDASAKVPVQRAQAVMVSGSSEDTYLSVQRGGYFQTDNIVDDTLPGATNQTVQVTSSSEVQFHANKPAFIDDFNMKASLANVKVNAVLAEYVAMMFFVISGCGSAMGVAKSPGWILQVSLTFGLAITVLGYAVGHYSGAHINCAVTFALCLVGQVNWCEAFYIFMAQLLGSISGALVLSCVCPPSKDLTGSLGSNEVSEGFSVAHALVGEFLMTLLLVFVVLETTVSPGTAASREMACVAIGLAVFLGHVVLIPVDGCSINPTRSFGPALVAKCTRGKGRHTFRDMWIFWLGPLCGATAAVGVFGLFG